MAAFPRYDAYKKSGVSWIGEIPKHWRSERAKWLFQKMERPVRPEDETVTAFRDGQVTLRTNRRTEGFTNAMKEIGYQGIRKGDLVIHAMDAFAGAIGVSDSDGKATPVYSVCVPRASNAVDNFYYAYLLRHMSKTGFIESLAKGIRERSSDFRFNDFANLVVPIPPLSEQTRIAAFLDEKTAEIDGAIAKKRRLIELLQEQQAILISRAVTRGLDPDAPMRDSGVPWIGEIPAHWEVKRNRYIFSEQNDRSKKGEEIHLSMSQKLGLVPASELDFQTLQSESYEGAKLCSKGDLVLNRLKAHLSVFSVAPCDGLVSSDYSVFRLNIVGYVPEYFENLFKTSFYLAEFNRRVRGIVVGFYRLYSGDFNEIPCIVPPAHEQVEIMAYVEDVRLMIASARSGIEREIAALNEFRTILIAEAVTGKIKI